MNKLLKRITELDPVIFMGFTVTVIGALLITAMVLFFKGLM